MKIRELIHELVSQVNNGEDIANEDAGELFRWLDEKSGEWREMTKRATAPEFMLSCHAKRKKVHR